VPDLLFVRPDKLERLSQTRLDGPADLVVELISEDSLERDRVEKLTEYAAAGVREYWAVDARPGRYGVEFFALVDGVYQPMPITADGRLWSTVVRDFWLRPAWLFQDPPPDVFDCLIEIAPDYLVAKQRRAAGDPTDPAADSAER
jgi:Uma2 family endonuclease